MILIVDSNIVENVYKEEDKFFLSECYVNLLKLGEVYVYVSLPSSIEDGVTYKCEIGSLIIKEIFALVKASATYCIFPHTLSTRLIRHR